MPDNSTHRAILRHWALLSKLPTTPPGITAADITQRLTESGFDESKRQVERDLNDLESFFALGCNEKGKPYGWYWPMLARKRFPGALERRVTQQMSAVQPNWLKR